MEGAPDIQTIPNNEPAAMVTAAAAVVLNPADIKLTEEEPSQNSHWDSQKYSQPDSQKYSQLINKGNK